MGCSSSIVNKPKVKEVNSDKTNDKTKTHPCFNPSAHEYARMHLPIAPKCNIQCNYCNRKYDCRNESRPGVTSNILSPKQALNRYKEVKEKFPKLTVVGIAGPGDALANFNETKETLRLIKEYDEEVTFCLSTNGLKLLKHVDELLELGVTHFTVTINTIHPEVAAKIYKFINVEGNKYFGIEAAKMLLDRQWEAVEYLRDKDVITKVNIVYIKGINDDHIVDIVKKAESLGVSVTNIMPLIPVKNTPFEHIDVASTKEISLMRNKCNEIMPQMLHCNQCRADAVGTLGKSCSGEGKRIS